MYLVDSLTLTSIHNFFLNLLPTNDTEDLQPDIFGGKAQPVPDAAGKILGDAVKVQSWN